MIDAEHPRVCWSTLEYIYAYVKKGREGERWKGCLGISGLDIRKGALFPPFFFLLFLFYCIPNTFSPPRITHHPYTVHLHHPVIFTPLPPLLFILFPQFLLLPRKIEKLKGIYLAKGDIQNFRAIILRTPSYILFILLCSCLCVYMYVLRRGFAIEPLNDSHVFQKEKKKKPFISPASFYPTLLQSSNPRKFFRSKRMKREKKKHLLFTLSVILLLSRFDYFILLSIHSEKRGQLMMGFVK